MAIIEFHHYFMFMCVTYTKGTHAGIFAHEPKKQSVYQRRMSMQQIDMSYSKLSITYNF